VNMDPTLAVGFLEKEMPGSIAKWEQATGQRYNPGFLAALHDKATGPTKGKMYEFDAQGEKRFYPGQGVDAQPNQPTNQANSNLTGSAAARGKVNWRDLEFLSPSSNEPVGSLQRYVNMARKDAINAVGKPRGSVERDELADSLRYLRSGAVEHPHNYKAFNRFGPMETARGGGIVPTQPTKPTNPDWFTSSRNPQPDGSIKWTPEYREWVSAMGNHAHR